MPETPDFDQIARDLLEGLDIDEGEHPLAGGWLRANRASQIAQQLRLIWNARGAADLAAVKRDLLGTCADTSHSDPDNSGQCIRCGVVLDYLEPSERAEQLDRAVRSLDR